MIKLLFSSASFDYLTFAGVIVAFTATVIMILAIKEKLPTDLGRAYAVNGEKSKGKPRGAGIIFVPVFVLVSILFVEISLEYILYYVLFLAAMMSGFLDDASRAPWGELKKGLFDLLIAVCASIVYVCYNTTTMNLLLFNTSVTLPAWLYVLLGTILVWGSINVVNCTDGVDGLSSTVSLISLGSLLVIFDKFGMRAYTAPVLIMMAVVMAYLIFNCSPSKLLMGDAGSRTLGVFFAVACMKTGCPLAFIPICLVFILDGGLGLLKVSLLRFLKIKIMTKIRTPLHDHSRKNLKWSDTQTVCRFALVQVIVSFIYLYLI